MRIGIDVSVLSDSKKTGIGVYVYNLVKQLLKVNKNDEFILFGFATFETYEFLKNLEFRKYPNVRLVIKKLPAKLFRTAFILWQRLEYPPVERFIGEVDICHSFNWYLPPQKKGIKVATVYDMTPILYPEYHHRRTVQLEKIRLERIKKKADLVITISESSKKDFLNFSPESKIEVVYPGFLEPPFTNSKDVLKKYNLAPNYFLSVGTLEPRKNLKGLIQVYLSGNFEGELVLVGAKGWEDEQLFKLIDGARNIRVLDYVDDQDLKILYKNALCLVYPSFYEGFGLPVLEAMSLGVPVICSNTSSLPEVGGDAPVYINPESLESIKNSMKILSKDKKLKAELIKKGLIQAKKFSWEKSAKKLNNLYAKL